MPANTPRLYPYPVGTDPIDTAGDIQRLATAIDLDTAAIAAVNTAQDGSIAANAAGVAANAAGVADIWARGVTHANLRWGGSGDATSRPEYLLIVADHIYFAADYYGDFIIYFPQVFAAGPLICAVTVSNVSTPIIVVTRSVSTTQIACNAYNHDGTPWRNGSSNVDFIAIGRRA